MSGGVIKQCAATNQGSRVSSFVHLDRWAEEIRTSTEEKQRMPKVANMQTHEAEHAR